MGKSLDIGYALAKENMVFRKYPAIHELGRGSMSGDGVDKGTEGRPSSDLNEWESWFNLSDDDSDIHVDTECESSSTETSELMTNTIISDFLI